MSWTTWPNWPEQLRNGFVAFLGSVLAFLVGRLSWQQYNERRDRQQLALRRLESVERLEKGFIASATANRILANRARLLENLVRRLARAVELGDKVAARQVNDEACALRDTGYQASLYRRWRRENQLREHAGLPTLPIPKGEVEIQRALEELEEDK
jgi:hypothetical protein